MEIEDEVMAIGNEAMENESEATNIEKEDIEQRGPELEGQESNDGYVLVPLSNEMA